MVSHVVEHVTEWRHFHVLLWVPTAILTATLESKSDQLDNLQAVLTLLLCVPLLQHGAAQSSHFRQQHQLRHQLQAALTPLIHAPAMQPRAVECGRAGVFLQMSLAPEAAWVFS